jgi:two-component system nitrate/nitrite sensor histidine kinase NarX
MSTSVRKRLADLVMINRSITWSRNPEIAVQKTVDMLAKALDADLAAIHLLDITGDTLLMQAFHGHIDEGVTSQMQISVTMGRLMQMMTTRQPLMMDYHHLHPDDHIPPSILSEYRCAISVPILADDDILGIFSLMYKRMRHWNAEDREFLLNIGSLLGVAVQHAQTATKETDLAILMERKRLSGELHDDLSQLITTLNLGAESALKSMEDGDTVQLCRELESIRSTSRKAARTLREEMLSLRTPTNETEGLIPGIRESLNRFEQQWAIHTDLQVEDDLEPLIVSSHMELQLMRILHESLSNVLRHAQASQVTVLLEGDQNRLCIQIQDDGRGFNPEAVSDEHLGIRIMRERADSLGGEIIIGSANETGTAIRVVVPRNA